MPKMPTINKTLNPKKKLQEKLPDYETKMQALTGCYFIFEKIINEHREDFTAFIKDHSLNQTDFYVRLRLDHISKCLMKIGNFNITKVIHPVFFNRIYEE